MIMVKAPFMKDDYPYCRTCKKELAEIEAVLRTASQEVDDTQLKFFGIENYKPLVSSIPTVFGAGDLVRLDNAVPGILTVGHLYTVKTMELGASGWFMRLEGIPGHWYNFNDFSVIGQRAILP